MISSGFIAAKFPPTQVVRNPVSYHRGLFDFIEENTINRPVPICTHVIELTRDKKWASGNSRTCPTENSYPIGYIISRLTLSIRARVSSLSFKSAALIIGFICSTNRTPTIVEAT